MAKSLFSAMKASDPPETVEMLKAALATYIDPALGERLSEAVRERGLDLFAPVSAVSVPGQPMLARAAVALVLLRRRETQKHAALWVWESDKAREAGDQKLADELEKWAKSRADWERVIADVCGLMSLEKLWGARAFWRDVLRLPLPMLLPLLDEAAARPALWADPSGDSPWNALSALSPEKREAQRSREDHLALHEALVERGAPANLGPNPFFSLLRESVYASTDPKAPTLMDADLIRALVRASFDFGEEEPTAAVRRWHAEFGEGVRLAADREERLANAVKPLAAMVEAEVLRQTIEAAKAMSKAKSEAAERSASAEPRRAASRL
jgi:hypothetical protein